MPWFLDAFECSAISRHASDSAHLALRDKVWHPVLMFIADERVSEFPKPQPPEAQGLQSVGFFTNPITTFQGTGVSEMFAARWALTASTK